MEVTNEKVRTWTHKYQVDPIIIAELPLVKRLGVNKYMCPIPTQLWDELRSEGLIPLEATSRAG